MFSNIMSSDDILVLAVERSASGDRGVGEAIKSIAIGACHECGKEIERKGV